jgi:hypothetical protein
MREQTKQPKLKHPRFLARRRPLPCAPDGPVQGWQPPGSLHLGQGRSPASAAADQPP